MFHFSVLFGTLRDEHNISFLGFVWVCTLCKVEMKTKR